jgi:Outer membrane protein beta-barrel domain
MKNIILAIAILFTTAMTAQVDSTKVTSDTTQVAMKTDSSKSKNEVSFIKGYKKGKIATYWFGLDFGFNAIMENGNLNLSAATSDLDMNYGKSTQWKIHVFRQEIDLYKNKVRLIYGPTFEFSRYNFTNAIKFTPNQPSLQINREPEGVRHVNNRLYTSWLQVPVMIGYESNPKRKGQSFRAAVGVYGSLLLASNHEYRVEGEANEVNIKDDFNLNTFRYGLTGRIGFGRVTLYADYALNSMFKEDQAPAAFNKLHSFSIGMTLLGWN